MRYNKFKKAYLIFNDSTNSLAILFQESESSKYGLLKILDDSFKEKFFNVTNLKRFTKNHHWVYLGEL